MIKVKGRYIPPGDTSTTERPLHLLVSGDSKESVNAAVGMIMDIIKKDEARQSQPFSFNTKIMVGMEGCDPQFGHIQRILGPEGSYLKHIATQSTATVVLKGSGSGHIEPAEGRGLLVSC